MQCISNVCPTKKKALCSTPRGQYGRVHQTRGRQRIRIGCAPLQVLGAPDVHHLPQDLPAIRDQARVWNRPRCLRVRVENTRVGRIQVDRGQIVYRTKLVAGRVGHEGEDVGPDVPPTEGGEIPIGREGGDFRVVVVKVGVGCVD